MGDCVEEAGLAAGVGGRSEPVAIDTGEQDYALGIKRHSFVLTIGVETCWIDCLNCEHLGSGLDI